MFARIFLLTTLYTCVGSADDQPLNKMGDHVQLVPRPASDVRPAKGTPGFQQLLDRIEITPSEGTGPRSFIVSGRVIDDNAGAPLERIPIYVGAESESPRLAGMTNIDGEFKFRLWLKEDHRECEIQVPVDFTGFLYVGGIPTMTPYQEVRLVAGFSRRYALKALLESVSKAKNGDDAKK